MDSVIDFMRIEQDFEGEIYEVEVKHEEKDNLTHLAHFPIKSGPRTFKSVNVFQVNASESGKKVVSFWKSRLSSERTLNVEEETQFKCQPDELEKLISVLDSMEDVVDLERGEHIYLKKDSPSSDAAIAAVNSIKDTESDEFEDILLAMLESIGELESEFEDIGSKIDDSIENLLKAENVLGYARTKHTVSEFEELIERNESEYEYQKFLEENPWLFGNKYLSKSDVRKLTRDEEVDFCLETVDGYYDIFEIKKPDHTVMVEDSSHDNYYASSELSKSVSQVENYINHIDKSHDEILARDSLNVLRPRGNIVIGSDLSNDEREGLRIYNNHLSRIRVLTYDEMVEMGYRLCNIYDSNSDSES